MLKNAILIAGPTASGKSALAVSMARRADAVVVNADSMQVYSVLRVLTARPSSDEMEGVPHRLYGHVDPRTEYSVARWLDDVAALLASPVGDRRVVFVGGTGLYFKALLQGLSQMPEIPPDLRSRLRQRLAVSGSAALHADLARLDPAAAARLNPSDGQRVLRALEVVEASGRSILEWQGERSGALVDANSATRMLLTPDRARLRARIDRRFDGMVEAGAVREAQALGALGLAPSSTATKAIGVSQFLDVAAGRLELTEAVDKAKAATRQYAKRQETWFRNQFDDGWIRLDEAAVASVLSTGELFDHYNLIDPVNRK